MELSDQGRTLVGVVLGGLGAGTALALVQVGGLPVTLYLLQYNGLVMSGWAWQLVTSIVVAPPNILGVLDVAFNAMAIWWLDGFFSMTYSKREYYSVFFATALAGNVFSLASGPQTVSFGASGGIFGLLAGVVSFDVATNRRLDVSLFAWFVAIFLVSSFVFASVDWLAHLGGALVGFGLGYAVGVRRGHDESGDA